MGDPTGGIEVPALETKGVASDALPFAIEPEPGPEPGEAPKRKYLSGAEKRKRRMQRAGQLPPEPAPPPTPMTPEEKEGLASLIGLLFTLTGSFVAARRGPIWEVGPEEAAKLGKQGVEALEPFGVNLGKWGGLIGFGAMVTVAVASRIQQERTAKAGPTPALTVERGGAP